METKTLKCEMRADCSNPVTYLDRKGYIYCENHGLERRGYQPCRKLRPAEIKKLQRGEVLGRY